MSYEPLNVQNRMCELCTFSQIQSHIRMHVATLCMGVPHALCMYAYVRLAVFGVYM